MTRFNLSQVGQKMVLETKLGKLVCWVVRDDEEYKEFAVDLIAKDGREYQVATIGTNEYPFYASPFLEGERLEESRRRHDCVHIYTWDGHDTDSTGDLYMDPTGDGYYYDLNE